MIEPCHELHKRRWFICDTLGFSLTTFAETELQAWMAFLGMRGNVNFQCFIELVRQSKNMGFYADNIDLSVAYNLASSSAN